MKKNYLVYPFRNMNITQSYSGKTSHRAHTTALPADYPVDEAGLDSGREYMYCPCDEMVVKRIYGVSEKGTNTIWLQSLQKVIFADGTSDYFTLMVTHPNDDDLKKIRVGQIFKRMEKICREGTDGNASGNHLHLSGGKGKMKGIGWSENKNGKWVLTVENKTEKPEKLFFVDESFTKVKKNSGLSFCNLADISRAEEKNRTYVVNTSLLYVRKGPGTNYDYLRYAELTSSARKQILALSGRKRDGYVKGVKFSVSKITDGWGETPSGWVSLEYCSRI